jgi:hypothetical protein
MSFAPHVLNCIFVKKLTGNEYAGIKRWHYGNDCRH